MRRRWRHRAGRAQSQASITLRCQRSATALAIVATPCQTSLQDSESQDRFCEGRYGSPSQEIVSGTGLVQPAKLFGSTSLAPEAGQVVGTDVIALLAGNWAVIPLACESPPTAKVADPEVATAITTM